MGRFSLKLFSRSACGVLSVFLTAGCSQPVPETASPAVEEPATAAVAATRTVNVTQGTNMSLALEPSGERLVVSVQGVLFTLPATGGQASAITDIYHDAREPSWTPDGQNVVFHGYRNGNWDIWTVAADGGEPRALTNDAFDDREPQVSPDGNSVVFSSDRGGSYDIWISSLAEGSSLADGSSLAEGSSPAGGILTRVTSAPGNEHSPAFSPQGRLAYAVAISRTAYELHLAATDGGDAEVAVSERGVISGISWRPDGNALSYQVLTRDSTGVPMTTLKILDLETGTAQAISIDGSDVFPFRAAWRDNNNLLYTADGQIKHWRDGTITPVEFTASFTLDRPDYERRKRNHDSSSPRRALGLVTPAISPDGERIAFTALGDLWLWAPQTSELSNLTDNPYAETTPAWSHDGTRLAYVSDRGGKPELWIYDFAGKTHDVVNMAVPGVSNPSWSPDGSAVAVFAQIPGNPLGGQLTIVDLASGETRNVNRPVPAQPVSWSWDGRYVAAAALAPYSSRYREGVYHLEVVDRQSGAIATITPGAHENMLDAVLTPTGSGMTYVQGATLWHVDLDEQFSPAGSPRQLTSELTDNPSWSAGGEYIVYMSGDRMKRYHVASSTTEDVTPDLQWTPDQPDEEWVLRAGRLFDGTRDGYQENVDIRITGNRIAAITPAAAVAPPGMVDMSGHTVIPGLFEMHAHMGATSGTQGNVWLGYGVTTVRDPGSNPYLAKERQEAWDSGRRAGPRTHVTGFLADGGRVYYSVAEGMVSEAHLDRALARTKALELDFVKTYVRLPDHWQAKVVRFAHEIGIPVSSHELFPAVAHGMDHVEHIGGTSRRGYQPKVSALGYSYSDVISLLSESGMGITATVVLPGFSVVALEEPDYFETRQFQSFYPPGARETYLQMASRFGSGAGAVAQANGRLLRALVEHDALLVTGTDAPFVPYGAGLHAELRLFARAGISPFDILRAATYKSAVAAGVADDLGTLEVGKLADFAVVDGDPLADIRDADNVVLTVKNGRRYPIEMLLNSPLP